MIIRIARYAIISFGCICLFMILICFTSLPFHAWYSLSLKKAGINRPPDCIVVLGGGGMPSETGLMRTWYAAQLANHYEHSAVIIALPGNMLDSVSSVSRMRQEMILRGVASSRIMIEDSGTNTRSQALLVFRMISKQGTSEASSTKAETSHPENQSSPRIPFPGSKGPVSIAIVTSPEHLCRAVLAFQEAGFTRVDGLPAFDNTIESDLTFPDNKLGGRAWIPDLGKNLTVRYRFWTQLHYEQLVMREYFALAFYWLKGWI